MLFRTQFPQLLHSEASGTNMVLYSKVLVMIEHLQPQLHHLMYSHVFLSKFQLILYISELTYYNSSFTTSSHMLTG